MVKARNIQTGLVREVASNSDGVYRLTLLPVGNYEVTFNKQGFASINRTGVKVQVGEAVTLGIQISAAGAAESVNVTTQGPIVETTPSEFASAVNDKAVAKLSTHRRNFIA